MSELTLTVINDVLVHYAVAQDGQRIGEVRRENSDGHIAVHLPGESFEIHRDRRAHAVAKGQRVGLLRHLVDRLRPDQRYSLHGNAGELATAQHVWRLGRDSHFQLTTATPASSWTVHSPHHIPRDLQLCRDGVACGAMAITGGFFRGAIRVDAIPLSLPIAVLLAYAVHRHWGNDPYQSSAGESGD